MTGQRVYIDPIPGYRSPEARRALLATRGRYQVVSRDEKAYHRKLVAQLVLLGLIVFVAVMVLSLAGVALVPDAAA